MNPPLCGIISNSLWLLENSTNASNFTSFVFSESHYNLPIPLRFARHAPDFTFGIGVSTIKKWPSAVSSVRYARTQESSSEGSLIGLSRLSSTAYAHTARRMKEFMGKKHMRFDRRNKE